MSLHALPFDRAFIRALSIAHMRRAPRVLLVPESLHGRARALVQAFAELPTMTPQAFRASVLYELITEGEDTPEESLRFLRENMSGHLADPSRPTWFEELDDALRADSHRARVVYLPELHRVGCAMLDVSPAERARCGEARATVRASLLAGRLNNLLRGDWRGAVVLAPGEPAWNAFFAAELGSCYLEMPVMVCEPVGGSRVTSTETP